MATYTELVGLLTNDDLRLRVAVATTIAARDLIDGVTPTPDQQKWAAAVFSNPTVEGLKMYRAVLAANKDASTAQITGATDAAIQTHVDSAVDALVVAHAAAP